MEALINYLKKNEPKGFTPQPYYSAAGDSLMFYFKDEQSYAERIDDFLTVYRSTHDQGLIGCQIKGLPQTLKLLGNFDLTIKDAKVTLKMIFLGCMAQSESAESKHFYLELSKAVQNVAIPREEIAQVLEKELI